MSKEDPAGNSKKAAARKVPGRPFQPGKSGNPSGRPKLSIELKTAKDEALGKAVRLLHEKIHDSAYIEALKPTELLHLLEVTFDRCGLPKVTKSELTGNEGAPLTQPAIPMIDFSKWDRDQVERFIEKTDAILKTRTAARALPGPQGSPAAAPPKA